MRGKDAMKNFCCKMKDFFCSLGRYSIEKKYDMTLALYADGETDTPECSHRFQGNARHNVMKIALMGVALTAMIAAVCSMYSACRMLKK